MGKSQLIQSLRRKKQHAQQAEEERKKKEDEEKRNVAKSQEKGFEKDSSVVTINPDHKHTQCSIGRVHSPGSHPRKSFSHIYRSWD
jgi:TFIIF-interacting CTD phosphatase-like protein